MNILSNRPELFGRSQLELRLSVVPQAMVDIDIALYASAREIFTAEQAASQPADASSYPVSAENTSSTRQYAVINTLSKSRATVEARNNVDRALHETSTPIPEAFPTMTSTQPDVNVSETPYDPRFYEESLKNAYGAHGDPQ